MEKPNKLSKSILVPQDSRSRLLKTLTRTLEENWIHFLKILECFEWGAVRSGDYPNHQQSLPKPSTNYQFPQKTHHPIHDKSSRPFAIAAITASRFLLALIQIFSASVCIQSLSNSPSPSNRVCSFCPPPHRVYLEPKERKIHRCIGT